MYDYGDKATSGVAAKMELWNTSWKRKSTWGPLLTTRNFETPLMSDVHEARLLSKNVHIEN